MSTIAAIVSLRVIRGVYKFGEFNWNAVAIPARITFDAAGSVSLSTDTFSVARNESIRLNLQNNHAWRQPQSSTTSREQTAVNWKQHNVIEKVSFRLPVWLAYKLFKPKCNLIVNGIWKMCVRILLAIDPQPANVQHLAFDKHARSWEMLDKYLPNDKCSNI